MVWKSIFCVKKERYDAFQYDVTVRTGFLYFLKQFYLLKLFLKNKNFKRPLAYRQIPHPPSSDIRHKILHLTVDTQRLNREVIWYYRNNSMKCLGVYFNNYPSGEKGWAIIRSGKKSEKITFPSIASPWQYATVSAFKSGCSWVCMHLIDVLFQNSVM